MNVSRVCLSSGTFSSTERTGGVIGALEKAELPCIKNLLFDFLLPPLPPPPPTRITNIATTLNTRPRKTNFSDERLRKLLIAHTTRARYTCVIVAKIKKLFPSSLSINRLLSVIFNLHSELSSALEKFDIIRIENAFRIYPVYQ